MSKRRGWPAALLGAALLATLALGGGAQPPTDPLPQPTAPAPKAKAAAPTAADVLKAADEFARKLAGTDDARYREILDGVLRDWLQREYGRGEARPRLGSLRGMRETAEPPLAAALPEVAPQRRVSSSDPAQVLERVREAKAASRLRPIPTARGDSMPDREDRVYGGVKAKPNEFPHCVAQGFNGGFSCCTGTLVWPNVVVTAAHCSAGGCTPNQVYFGLDANPGQIDRSRIRAIKEGGVIRHPSYNPTTKENDIALLILDKPVDIPDVKPCPLASAADIATAKFFRVAGFGITDQGIRNILFTTDLGNIISRGCEEAQIQQQFPCNAGKEIVAGGYGKDTCRGDSGGPLYVVKDNNVLLLAGVTSRGSDPCGAYGMYTRVDVYKDWITRTAKANGGIPDGTTDTVQQPGPQVATPDSGYAAEIRIRIDWWQKNYPKLVPP